MLGTVKRCVSHVSIFMTRIFVEGARIDQQFQIYTIQASDGRIQRGKQGSIKRVMPRIRKGASLGQRKALYVQTRYLRQQGT